MHIMCNYSCHIPKESLLDHWDNKHTLAQTARFLLSLAPSTLKKKEKSIAYY